jgi:hypothetical protein
MSQSKRNKEPTIRTKIEKERRKLEQRKLSSTLHDFKRKNATKQKQLRPQKSETTKIKRAIGNQEIIWRPNT